MGQTMSSFLDKLFSEALPVSSAAADTVRDARECAALHPPCHPERPDPEQSEGEAESKDLRLPPPHPREVTSLRSRAML